MKKDFKDPTLAYITTAEQEEETVQEAEHTADLEAQPAKEEPKTVRGNVIPPKGYKLNRSYVETKSQRMQILLQPSVAKDLKKLAKKKKLSVNWIINDAIIEYLDREETK